MPLLQEIKDMAPRVGILTPSEQLQLWQEMWIWHDMALQAEAEIHRMVKEQELLTLSDDQTILSLPCPRPGGS